MSENKPPEKSKSSKALREKVLGQLRDMRARIHADNPNLLPEMQKKLIKAQEEARAGTAWQGSAKSKAGKAPWDKTGTEPEGSVRIDKRKNLEAVKTFLKNSGHGVDFQNKLVEMIKRSK